MVTFFKPDTAVHFPQAGDMKELQKALDTILPLTDEPCAIKVDGEFKYIKVRSVPRQQKPYPGLEEALKHQTFFELKNVSGTLVGFRFPCLHGRSKRSRIPFPLYHRRQESRRPRPKLHLRNRRSPCITNPQPIRQPAQKRQPHPAIPINPQFP